MRKVALALRRAYFRIVRAILLFLVDRLYGADLFWDNDDPEQPFYSVQERAHELIDFDGVETTADGTIKPLELTMQRAFALPTRRYEITPFYPDPENTDDVDVKIRRLPRKPPKAAATAAPAS